MVCLLLTSLVSAQQKSKVELQVSETIFSVVTAMNACGYDDGLPQSEPVRTQVRNAISTNIEHSPEAAMAKKELCEFYREHQPSDANHDLSQYLSLALNLSGPPDFKPLVKEADMPPDTDYVLGFIPLLANFYKAADVHHIWNSVFPQYRELIEKFNEPVSKMILQTDIYLKNPISGYAGPEFVIFLEPMAGPAQVNARNYGENYYLVASPSNGQLPMDQLRHTYLHFTLDPLAMKRPAAMHRLAPLLKTVQGAPIEASFKTDISLLVTESLIRAIEARLEPGGKAADPKREEDVNKDMQQGFVLTRYFYEALVKFEPEPTSLKDAFPDFLYYLDVGHEVKRASQIQFSSEAQAEVVKGKTREQRQDPLDVAQQKLAEGDFAGAQKLAQDTLDKKSSDAPRACFILGQLATLNKDKDGAIQYFEQALRTSSDPKLIAWSHIYLGRIYDVDQDRDMAVKHYQAALRAGDDTPQTKAAAEKGLKAPYERSGSPEENQ